MIRKLERSRPARRRRSTSAPCSFSSAAGSVMPHCHAERCHRPLRLARAPARREAEARRSARWRSAAGGTARRRDRHACAITPASHEAARERRRARGAGGRRVFLAS